MRVIEARNVHQALPLGMGLLVDHGIFRDSRNGQVLVADGPVTTVYDKPKERVIFWPERDANPFFHFMEGLWMLAGRNDVKWISQFSSNIKNYSDDRLTFHGAYGHRWINHFNKEVILATKEIDGVAGSTWVPFNQLEAIAEILKKNKDDRRAVLQMWNAEDDLGKEGKDFPCNTQIYFSVDEKNLLNMSVCNRSNDIIWGAYGANAVHMSMLQEFMAAWIGVEVGRYWQISNNYHAYTEVFEKHKSLISDRHIGTFEIDPYQYGRKGRQAVSPFPMVNKPVDVWMSDLTLFMEQGPVTGFNDVFFRRVVNPIWNSWFAYKNKESGSYIEQALAHLEGCVATDWQLACKEWLERRKDKNS